MECIPATFSPLKHLSTSSRRTLAILPENVLGLFGVSNSSTTVKPSGAQRASSSRDEPHFSSGNKHRLLPRFTRLFGMQLLRNLRIMPMVSEGRKLWSKLFWRPVSAQSDSGKKTEVSLGLVLRALLLVLQRNNDPELREGLSAA